MTNGQQSNLEWLECFYQSLCNGDWEHGYGFFLENIDNPGWLFSFEVQDTFLEGQAFEEFMIERSEEDWVYCRIDGSRWKGVGGARNLNEIIGYFRNWAEAELKRQGL
jgi:hypothetical protein